MKKLLAVFPKESGGEWVAMKNLSSWIFKNSPKKVFVEEVEGLAILWRSHKRLQLIQNFFKSCFSFIKVLWRYKKKNIQILYSNSLLFLFLAYVFYTFDNYKVSLFYHFHGRRHETAPQECEKEKSFIRKFFYIFPFYCLLLFIEKSALKKVQAVFLPSKSGAVELEELFGCNHRKKFKIIPSGYSRMFFYPKKKTKRNLDNVFRLLYVGRIDPVKNIECIIKSFLYLRTKIDCKLDVVFPQITNENVKEWFYKLIGKKNGINLFIDLDPMQIGEMYRQADLTLLLSSKENFPLVFLESIACGTPVVTSVIEGIISLQEKISSDLIVRKITPERVAKVVLKHLHLSKKEKEEIKQRCLGLAKKFSWQRSAGLILKVINEET